MTLRGLLLSLLFHVALAWAVWQGGWITSASEVPAASPEQILVARFQPVSPKMPPRSETPPATQVPEALPESPEPLEPGPEKKVVSEPPVPPAAEIVTAPKPKTDPVSAAKHSHENVKEEAIPPVESSPARLPDSSAPESRDETVKTANRTSKSSPVPVAESKAIAQASYVQRLTERIDRHKSYSRRARERGLSGEVRFSIAINGNGELETFEWLEGHGVFRRSTLQAVQRALPYPPEPGLAPVNVQIRMIYSLHDRR